MARSNHVFSCKKIAKNALCFLLFPKKFCIFATTLLCPSCATLHRGDNDAPNKDIFIPPKNISSSMKIKEVAETLERFAPLPLQESYDNAGLQIGLTVDEDVSGVLLCLDVTEQVIDEAQHKGCNLIVSHHPLLFRPLRHLTMQTQVERCVCNAIKANVGIYAAHTNLDNAPGGVNFMIAEKLGLNEVDFLQPLQSGKGGSGIVGSLPQPLEAAQFLNKVRSAFGIDCLMHNAAPNRPIQRVAVCGGAGDFLLDTAIEQGADAFLTGEMGYHRYFGHENEVLIGVMGHYQSERFTIELLQRILQQAYPTLRILKTEVDTNPILVN